MLLDCNFVSVCVFQNYLNFTTIVIYKKNIASVLFLTLQNHVSWGFCLFKTNVNFSREKYLQLLITGNSFAKMFKFLNVEYLDSITVN